MYVTSTSNPLIVAFLEKTDLYGPSTPVSITSAIIFFYNIPEKLVDEEEAKYISKEILKEQPDNEVALGV